MSSRPSATFSELTWNWPSAMASLMRSTFFVSNTPLLLLAASAPADGKSVRFYGVDRDLGHGFRVAGDVASCIPWNGACHVR